MPESVKPGVTWNDQGLDHKFQVQYLVHDLWLLFSPSNRLCPQV